MSTSLQSAPAAATTPEPRTGLKSPARLIALVGALLLIVTPFLPWAYGASALDDMTVAGYPSILQSLALALGVLIAALLVGSTLYPARPGRRRVGWVRGAKSLSIGAVAFLVIILAAISLELGGAVNVEIGGWLALLGAVLACVAPCGWPTSAPPTWGRCWPGRRWRSSPSCC